MLDFGGLDSSTILIFEGWNARVHRELPGRFESANLSRDTLSREIERRKAGGRFGTQAPRLPGSQATWRPGTLAPSQQASNEWQPKGP